MPSSMRSLQDAEQGFQNYPFSVAGHIIIVFPSGYIPVSKE